MINDEYTKISQANVYSSICNKLQEMSGGQL